MKREPIRRKSSIKELCGIALEQGQRSFKANRYVGIRFRPHTIRGRRG